MSRIRKSDLAPLNRACRTAIERILGDRYLRVFVWCLLVEDLGAFRVGEVPLNARDAALRLLEDLKAVSLDNVHKAEKEYASLLEQDEVWRKKNEQQEETPWQTN